MCKKFFVTFPVKNQLTTVLENNINIDLFSLPSKKGLSEIKDSKFYRQLKMTCSDPFITLTMNIDGAEIKKDSKHSI